MRRVATLVVLAAVVAACGASESTPVTITRSAAVLAALDPDAPGCAAAVSVDGETVWHGARGLAEMDPDVPIDERTVFDIGSTSKQFTANAVLLLVQSGAVDLDAPVSRYLTDLPSWSDATTIEQLMHHTSGIPDYIDLLDGDFDRHMTIEAEVDVLRGVDVLDFDPGSMFAYSNSNYLLLSQVVESVTGQTLADYLEEQVFEPLQLDAVMALIGEVPRLAASYEDGEESVQSWEQTGDGGMQTTPVQLVRWAPQYWNPSIGGLALQRARTAGAVDQGEGEAYGAGIIVTEEDDGTPVLSHTGYWEGFVTDLAIDPAERVAAAVSCNEGSLDASSYAFELLDIWRD